MPSFNTAIFSRLTKTGRTKVSTDLISEESFFSKTGVIVTGTFPSIKYFKTSSLSIPVNFFSDMYPPVR